MSRSDPPSEQQAEPPREGRAPPARMSRPDWLPAAVLWAVTFLIFGAGAPRLGFYYDDAPALASLPQAGLSELASHIAGYVPGRNLHVLWQYLLLKLTPNLTALHLVQSALDGAVVVAFFVLLRRFAIPSGAAFLAAALFSFWPTHGETHFWLYAAPQNVLSTFFVVLFALAGHPLFFLAALFTYDQTVFVLLAIAALRGFQHRRPIYLLYLLPLALFAWLKIARAPGRGPELRSNAVHMLAVNIPDTLSKTMGRLWLRQVVPLFENVTLADWVLAAVAALAVTVLAFRLLRASQPCSRLCPVLPLAALFWTASYLPIWLWHVSSRHHYLPSIGLFAGGAAVLAMLRPRRTLAALLGIAVFLLAAASRGESRYWEESFTLKQRLFADLRPHLAGKQVLALEGFPAHLGPAYLMSPPDAAFAPRLLFPDTTVIAGDVSHSPALAGIFLQTQIPLYGPEAFRYHPTDRYLVARFTSQQGGRLGFEVDPAPAPPYEVLDTRRTPADAAFRVHQATLRGDFLTLDLDAQVRLGRYLACTVAFLPPGGVFHRWSGPLALGPAGAFRLTQTLRLRSFPATPRALIQFYETGPNDPPARLGGVEVIVDSGTRENSRSPHASPPLPSPGLRRP